VVAKDFDVSVSISTPLLSVGTWDISIARDLINHELTKHVDVDAYFTQSQVQDGIIALQYVFKALVDRFLHEDSDSCPLILPLQTQC
jgi:hypothetical protein